MVVLLTAPCTPASGSLFSRGTVSLGGGYASPTTQKDIVGGSPSFTLHCLIPAGASDQGVSLGVVVGNVLYRSDNGDLSGSHTYGAGLIHWTMLDRFMPLGMRLFGQIALGFSRVKIERAGFVEKQPSKMGFISLGIQVPINAATGFWLTTTLQRIDTSPFLFNDTYVSWAVVGLHAVWSWGGKEIRSDRKIRTFL